MRLIFTSCIIEDNSVVGINVCGKGLLERLHVLQSKVSGA